MNSDIDPDVPSGDGIYGLPFRPEDSRVVLVPVPWDATTSYRAGAAGGPDAILAASLQLDLEDRDTGRPYGSGIAMLPIPGDVRNWNGEARKLAEPVIEAYGPGVSEDLKKAVDEVNHLSEWVNTWVYRTAGEWLDRDKIVGVVGGDHSSPFGLIRAVAERHPGVGILHLDAHADTRRAFEGFIWSHASIMYNVLDRIPQVGKLVQVGIRDFSRDEGAFLEGQGRRAVTFFDSDVQARLLEGEPFAAVAREVVGELPEEVYLSFDIDGLDPALCPNTGTPVPGGLSFAQAVALLRETARSGRRVVGFDLCEVAPHPSGEDEWDGNVGMRLLYKMIGYALLSSR